VNFQNFHVSNSTTKPWACILGLYVICSVLDGSLTEFVFFCFIISKTKHLGNNHGKSEWLAETSNVALLFRTLTK